MKNLINMFKNRKKFKKKSNRYNIEKEKKTCITDILYTGTTNTQIITPNEKISFFNNIFDLGSTIIHESGSCDFIINKGSYLLLFNGLISSNYISAKLAENVAELAVLKDDYILPITKAQITIPNDSKQIINIQTIVDVTNQTKISFISNSSTSINLENANLIMMKIS